MAYTLKTTHRFEKDLERCKKRGLPMDKFKEVVSLLVRDGCLPPIYRPHKLRGDRSGEWECHIQPDWLLVWLQSDEELTLILMNTGTHSDLFEKKRRS